jgi:hypothetical protein
MAFLFRLEMRDGQPAEPSTLRASTPTWNVGDVIVLGAGRGLRVVGKRDDDADAPPVLVVEDMAERANGAAA